MDSRVGVRDVTWVLVRQIQRFIVAECLGRGIAVLNFGLAEINASPINSGRGSRFHAACGEPVFRELACDAFCSPFARAAALKLLMTEVYPSLEKCA